MLTRELSTSFADASDPRSDGPKSRWTDPSPEAHGRVLNHTKTLPPSSETAASSRPMASFVRTRLCDRRASAVSRSYAVAADARPSSASPNSANERPAALKPATVDEEEVPTSGICRPLSEILRELNKKVPDSLIRTRVENGVATRHIPWFASPLSTFLSSRLPSSPAFIQLALTVAVRT